MTASPAPYVDRIATLIATLATTAANDGVAPAEAALTAAVYTRMEAQLAATLPTVAANAACRFVAELIARLGGEPPANDGGPQPPNEPEPTPTPKSKASPSNEQASGYGPLPWNEDFEVEDFRAPKVTGYGPDGVPVPDASSAPEPDPVVGRRASATPKAPPTEPISEPVEGNREFLDVISRTVRAHSQGNHLLFAFGCACARNIYRKDFPRAAPARYATLLAQAVGITRQQVQDATRRADETCSVYKAVSNDDTASAAPRMQHVYNDVYPREGHAAAVRAVESELRKPANKPQPNKPEPHPSNDPPANNPLWKGKVDARGIPILSPIEKGKAQRRRSALNIEYVARAIAYVALLDPAMRDTKYTVSTVATAPAHHWARTSGWTMVSIREVLGLQKKPSEHPFREAIGRAWIHTVPSANRSHVIVRPGPAPVQTTPDTKGEWSSSWRTAKKAKASDIARACRILCIPHTHKIDKAAAKAARDGLIMQYHPDRAASGATPDPRMVQMVTEAYAVLVT